MNQVNANNAQSFLLVRVILVEHAYMNNNDAVFGLWSCLKANTHPGVALVCTEIILCRNGIGKSKKTRTVTALFSKSFAGKLLLILQHRLKPLTADIAFTITINGVANLHVIGGYAF